MKSKIINEFFQFFLNSPSLFNFFREDLQNNLV